MKLEDLLKRVINNQMIADVPLGAFLSGGIDSSTVVALMQSQSSQPVKTFTIGFWEKAYNEAPYAQAVAQHLGCKHTELYITPQEAIAVIPQLSLIYDEPFADASQIPTFLVAKLAKQQVTVSLTGDGGDEIFGGYSQYFWGEKIWRGIRWLPWTIRRAISQTLTTFSPEFFNNLFSHLPNSPFTYFSPAESLARLASVMGEQQAIAIYQHLISEWRTPTKVVLNTQELLTPITNPEYWSQDVNLYQQMMYLDLITELPDDILVKVDRATMSVSLESRTPFLDHRIIELAWQLPLSNHIKNYQGKQLLRQILSRYLPVNLIERPKQGFAMPIAQWLRSSTLRDWAESLLNLETLRNQGIFQPQLIRQKWQQHLDGDYNWQSHLWIVLMFQSWLENL